ncbi:MAG TPA: hypothetical protein VIT65_23160 [Microlunatus sp.]
MANDTNKNGGPPYQPFSLALQADLLKAMLGADPRIQAKFDEDRHFATSVLLMALANGKIIAEAVGADEPFKVPR